MQFTIEEKKTINRLLKEREELQKNINCKEQKEYYTTEEIWGRILELFYRDIQDSI